MKDFIWFVKEMYVVILITVCVGFTFLITACLLVKGASCIIHLFFPEYV